ncbi:hypothetical protein AX17_005257 [Amanita inopinata Kibby_2008]|nr:hypothetical protein AX17_005257 [Amanita inopinata Kibby_2008]
MVETTTKKPMRQQVDEYIRSLQDRIVTALEELDPNAPPFKRDSWVRAQGGSGQSCVFASPVEEGAGGVQRERPTILEKAGVNISIVHGVLPPPAIRQMRADHTSMPLPDRPEGLPFFAAGISLVIHPRNPHAPTVHANYRYFEITEPSDDTGSGGEAKILVWWFGGGSDLTPAYLYEEDAVHFHSTLKEACDKHGSQLYPSFKKWCDEYFFIPHRGESRGIGGIFFDDLNEGPHVRLPAATDGGPVKRPRTPEEIFAFIKDTGDAFVPSYVPILAKRHSMPCTDHQRRWQLIRRGRYVEFNLVYDRGTKFGLVTPGARIESILMSLPEVARWEYMCELGEEGTEEGRVVKVLQVPKDWDRDYAVLLNHLLNEKPVLPFSTIQAALAHHLADLSPLPTPLAASAVSSALYSSRPFTHEKLQSLATAFRHAIHLKLKGLEKNAETQSTSASLFTKSPTAATAHWVVDVVKGLQGGHPMMRMSCCTGLLQGIEDLETAKHETEQRFDTGRGRDMVENELIIAVAEIVDSYGIEPMSDWVKEFGPTSAEPEALSLSLIMTSQSLPLVSRTRLKALPLSVLNRMLVFTISRAFQSGTFLSTLKELPMASVKSPLHIPALSANNLRALTSSPEYTSIALLSKLTALSLGSLLDSHSRRVQEAMKIALETLSSIRSMAETIESDWLSSPLFGRKDEDIDLKSRDTSKCIWSILKTFLFSTIMISQAAISAVVYIPPNLFLASARPQHLALEVLHTLDHLSFVLSEFGGVAANSGGFPELKRTVYLAIDILAQGREEAEIFVKNVSEPLGITGSGHRDISSLPLQIQWTKKAYVLVCMEQLVPVLSTDCVRDWVWELCYPHLSDISHREIYESAHSVILAILSSRSQVETDINGVEKFNTPTTDPASPLDFVTRIIPFYAQCLIENSGDGKLSTTQLQLAYQALVRSAAASSSSQPVDSRSLSWYCVQALIDAIQDLTNKADKKGKGKENESELHGTHKPPGTQLQRLRLTLIATVSSLPLPLMLRVLDEIGEIMVPHAQMGHQSQLDASLDRVDEKARDNIDEEHRNELVDALFAEILEQVGDREKEAAMRWWYANRERLGVTTRVEVSSTRQQLPEAGR